MKKLFLSLIAISILFFNCTENESNMENEALSEDYMFEFKNFTHEKPPTKRIRIKGTVNSKPTSGAPTMSSGPVHKLTVTIPAVITNQGAILLELNPVETSDGIFYVGQSEPIEDIPAGTTYTSTVNVLADNGNLITSKDIFFEVNEVEK